MWRIHHAQPAARLYYCNANKYPMLTRAEIDVEITKLQREIREGLAAMREELEAAKAAHLDFLTVAQAAAYLNVKPGTVRQYIHRGRITKMNSPGKRIYIERAELRKVIEGPAKGVTPTA